MRYIFTNMPHIKKGISCKCAKFMDCINMHVNMRDNIPLISVNHGSLLKQIINPLLRHRLHHRLKPIY